MRAFVPLVAALGALTLSACATKPLVPPSAEVGLLQGVTTLEASYNVAAQAYLAELPSMSPDQHDQAKSLLVRAYGAVEAAETAQSLGDATTVNTQIALASSLIGQAKALLK